MKQKKIKNIFIVCIIFITTLILIIGGIINSIKSYTTSRVNLFFSDVLYSDVTKVQNESTPEFYGTVGINLKVGDTLDLENSMFEIYAKDYYDGDLTHNITVVDNNVNTGAEGSYHIVYSVKNSQDIETEIEVPVNIMSDGERTITRKLYTTRYGWNTKLNQGYGNKGVDHDRQHLGIYTKAGATLKIRQTQESYDENNKVKIDILNKDQKAESLEIEVSTTNENTLNWQEIVIENNSVPFVNTIDTTEQLNQKIEINIEDVYSTTSQIKPLTYYLYGDNETEFINKWDESQDDFSLLESDRLTMLVPIDDKETIREIVNGTSTFDYPFESLSDLFIYYKNIFEFYDNLIGLDFYATEEIDKNERTKFFVKADLNGFGLAYYSYRYTAQNITTVSSSGIEIPSVSEYLQKTWTNLHEIGHGYEGDIGRKDIDINLNETQNNIFAYYFQQTFLKDGDNGWLGLISEKEEGWNQERKALTKDETFNSFAVNQDTGELANHDDRLYMMVNMLNKTGLTRSMSTLYKNSRRDHYNNYGKTKEADLIAKSFSEASKFNVVPYLESWKIAVSETTKEEIEAKNYKKVYFLRDLVTKTNAQTIKNAKGLDGIYSLVTEDEISEYITDKIGTLIIPFDDNFYNFFPNSQMVITKESTEVSRIDATNKQVSINLAPGIYKVNITNTELELKQQYVNVEENGTVTKSLDMKLKDFDHEIDESGNATIIGYYGKSTQVEIPSKICNYNIVGIDKDVFKNNTTVEKITIPNTVTTIGDNAFDNCSNLTTIGDLSNVTSMGSCVFYNCSSLTSIGDLLNVTSMGSYAFYNCNNLTGTFDISNLTSIESCTFYNCRKLSIVGYLTNVTYIKEWAFSNCSNITNIEDLENVTSIGAYAFYNCVNLTKIELGKDITIIGEKAFYQCNNLTIYGYRNTVAYIYANNNSINFIDRSVQKIEVKTLPNKIEYILGEQLNTTGLVLIGTNSNGSTFEITSGYTCTPTELNAVGKQTILVTYEGKITTYEVTVEKVTLSTIEVKTKPNKLTYYVGDKLDTKGLVLIGTNNDGSTFEITSGYTCTPTELNAVGKQTITVTYGEKTTTYEVTVNKKTIDMTGITFANKTVTYNGESHRIDIGGNLPKEVEVTYEGNEKVVVGTYEIIARFKVDTEIYNEIPEKTAILTIEKAIPKYEEPIGLTATYGDMLSTVELPNKFQWEASKDAKVGDAGVNTFTVKYTPEDTTNYKEVTRIKVEVNVEKADSEVNPIYDTSSPIYIGGRLPEIELSEGDTPGQIGWDEYELEVGIKEYGWTYIPIDSKNYKTKKGKQSISVLEEIVKLKVEMSEYENKNSQFITKIVPNTTIQELKKNINTNGIIEIYNGQNKIENENEKIATGMTIKISLGNEQLVYKAVVKGDLNGDAEINEIDLLKLVRYRVGLDKDLTNEYLEATNVFYDGILADDRDVLKLVRTLVKLDTL